MQKHDGDHNSHEEPRYASLLFPSDVAAAAATVLQRRAGRGKGLCHPPPPWLLLRSHVEINYVSLKPLGFLCSPRTMSRGAGAPAALLSQTRNCTPEDVKKCSAGWNLALWKIEERSGLLLVGIRGWRMGGMVVVAAVLVLVGGGVGLDHQRQCS
ncbi:unnamed protein product [Merluccius merluccius]